MNNHLTILYILLSATIISVASAKTLNNDALISLIVGESDATDYQTRIHAVSALPITLEEEQSQRLMTFLTTYYSSDMAVSKGEMNALKNNILASLIQQNQPLESLLESMTQMYTDARHTTQWRSYVVQYFPKLYEKTHDERIRAGSATQLWHAVSMTNSSIAGCALLALHHISRHDSAFDKEKIADIACAMLTGTHPVKTLRTTPLQIAMHARRPEALTAAREYMNSSVPLPVKISAIHVMGEMGDASDAELLRQIAKKEKAEESVTVETKKSHRRLAPFIEKAIEKIEEQINANEHKYML